MTKVQCIKSFSVEGCDDDGFKTGKDYSIEKDTVWNIEDNPYRLMGGKIRLTKDDDSFWIETSKKTFKSHFMAIGGTIDPDIDEKVRAHTGLTDQKWDVE